MSEWLVCNLINIKAYHFFIFLNALMSWGENQKKKYRHPKLSHGTQNGKLSTDYIYYYIGSNILTRVYLVLNEQVCLLYTQLNLPCMRDSHTLVLEIFNRICSKPFPIKWNRLSWLILDSFSTPWLAAQTASALHAALERPSLKCKEVWFDLFSCPCSSRQAGLAVGTLVPGNKQVLRTSIHFR